MADTPPLPKRLLVVDDQPEVVRVVCRLLQRHGYEATLCTSVEEAGAMLTGGRYDGALVDLHFGELPAGLDLVAEIRSRPETAEMPVVSMSGSGTAALARCLAAGADATLEKPFALAELLEALERASAARS